MKRVLKWFVFPLSAIVVVLVIVANLLVDPAGELAAPDPALVITLPDGRRESLGDLLERADLDAPSGPADESGAAAEEVLMEAEESSPALRAQLEDGDIQIVFRWPPELAPGETDVFRLGRHAMLEGRVEEALALLQSVSEEHAQYDTAQRFIGWELLTKRMDRPALGLAYMNRALDAAPLEGENWQDASRVYLRTLGIRWDPVNNVMR